MDNYFSIIAGHFSVILLSCFMLTIEALLVTYAIDVKSCLKSMCLEVMSLLDMQLLPELVCLTCVLDKFLQLALTGWWLWEFC